MHNILQNKCVDMSVGITGFFSDVDIVLSHISQEGDHHINTQFCILQLINRVMNNTS